MEVSENGGSPKPFGDTSSLGHLYIITEMAVLDLSMSHRFFGRLWLAQRLCKHATRSSASACGFLWMAMPGIFPVYSLLMCVDVC